MEHIDGDIAQLRKEHDFGVREIAKSCWDVKYGVAQTCAFIRLITLEGQTLCIELSGKGYRIIGDEEMPEEKWLAERDNNHHKGPFYETMQALLLHISPLYRQAFHNELCKKLSFF